MRRIQNLKDVVDWGLCTGCGACYYACSADGVTLTNIESVGIRPRFEKQCAGCTKCLSICPGYSVDGNLLVGTVKQTEADHEFGPALEIWEGYASDPEIRYRGSSGGVISALALYCLEQEKMGFVLHTGGDEAKPWLNTTVQSRTRAELLSRGGSRYAPASPCDSLAAIESSNSPCVFIGKPCDTAAVMAARRERCSLDQRLGLVLAFFCAGTPSTDGTLDLLQRVGVKRSAVEQLRYRGEGWPGSFTVISNQGKQRDLIPYDQAWGVLTSYISLRCRLCPDGLGRIADISCGDAWEQKKDVAVKNPGVSIILVRTQRGREILRRAAEAGYVRLIASGVESVFAAQANLLSRRRELFGRLLALKLFLIPIPNFRSFSLLRGWSRLPVSKKLRTIAGTVRRAIMRGWWKRRAGICREPNPSPLHMDAGRNTVDSVFRTASQQRFDDAVTPNKAADGGLRDASGNLCCLTNITADESRATVHPRVCLLGADYLNSNLGIRALTTGAITTIFAQQPRADVQILEYGAASRQFIFELPHATVSVQMLNMRFSKRLWVQNHIARLIGTAVMLKGIPPRSRMKLVARNPWLRELMQADCVLALSGGDSFSDIYGLQRFFYMSLPQILVLLLGKNLIQLPQTIGPFKRKISCRVARWILSRSTLVYSRDEEAVPQIRSLIPEKQRERVRFCPDLGFVVPAKVPARIDPQLEIVFSRRPVVGFNVSGLLYMGGYTQKNMFGLASDYKTLVQRAIAHFIEVKNTTVLLVPHVATHQGEGDALVCDEVMRELQPSYPGHLYSLQELYDECEIKSVIGQCDFFVGARMHSCIAALSQSVPTAVMAYGDKFAGVLRSAGMLDAVADLRVLSADQVIALLSSLYDSRTSLKSRLEVKIPLIRNAVFGLLQPDTQTSAAFATVLSAALN